MTIDMSKPVTKEQWLGLRQRIDDWNTRKEVYIKKPKLDWQADATERKALFAELVALDKELDLALVIADFQAMPLTGKPS